MSAFLIHLCDAVEVVAAAAAVWFASGIVSGRYESPPSRRGAP